MSDQGQAHYICRNLSSSYHHLYLVCSHIKREALIYMQTLLIGVNPISTLKRLTLEQNKVLCNLQ